MLRFFCFLAVVLGARCASAPFIKPCKPEESSCILASAQNAMRFMAPGIPELDMRSLDPMTLDEVISDQSGLKLVFTDTVVTGIKGCTIDAIKHDGVKGKQFSTIRCDVVLKGHYKMSGNLLLLPIQGEGRHTIKIRDIVIKTHNNLTTVQGADGKPHWHITKWRHSFTVKTSTHFNFENLFNGNKVLGEPILAFANNNWRDVMNEIAPPIVYAIVSRCVDSIEALYKAVPIDELTMQ